MGDQAGEPRRVALTPRQVSCAAAGLRTLINERHLQNRPVPAEFKHLHDQLRLMLMSVDGTPSGASAAPLDLQDLIDSTAAAAILGCSTRYVTRIRKDLDGRKIGRVWVFSRSAVLEYRRRKAM